MQLRPFLLCNKYCGGPEEFVHSGNGLLIDVDDEQALTDAMIKMYNTSHCYDGEKISREIIENFSPQAIANQLTNVYYELLYKNNMD